MTPLGAQLKRLRIEKEESMRTMAKQLAMSPAMLSAIELGHRRPTPEFLDKVAGHFKAFGVSRAEWERLARLSNDQVDVSNLDYEDRGLVEAFARSLQRQSEAKKRRIRQLLLDI